MAGVGKLLKQAQKMQKQMEAIQEELADRVVPLHAMAAEITRAAGRST